MRTKLKNPVKYLRIAAILAFGVAAFSGLYYSRSASAFNARSGFEKPTPTPRSKKKVVKPVPKPAASKFSKFTHTTHLAMDMACDSCHTFPTANWEKVRSKDAAFPDVTDYPKHESCITCHEEQFFAGKQPAICSNCHVNPSPKDSTRHPFANPRELFDASAKGKNTISQFQVYFPHDKHADLFGMETTPEIYRRSNGILINASNRRADESCATCHQTIAPQGNSDDEYYTVPPKNLGDGYWLKKGTFKSSPISHASCFSCHAADSGMSPEPKDCAKCHKPRESEMKADFDAALAEKMKVTDKVLLSEWKNRNSTGKYRHEFFMHADLSCASCHNVSKMDTSKSETTRVAIMSCGGGGAGCHISPTLDEGGLLNFEIDSRKKKADYQCVKCHVIYGKSPIPESHTKAIAEIASGK